MNDSADTEPNAPDESGARRRVALMNDPDTIEQCQVQLRDVGPRDGLQSETPLPPSVRARLALDLAECGLRAIEAVSFVSPRAVPAMADPEQVLALLAGRSDVDWWALVPNPKGAQLATAAGIEAITVTISASPGYSRKNTGSTPAEATAALPTIVERAPGARFDVVVSCAFGSPFDDVDGPDQVAELVAAARTAMTTRITLADTTGTATPRRIAAVLAATGTDVGLHLHDTRGTALANALRRARSSVCAGSTLRSAGSAVPRSPPAPAATWRRRTWCSCSKTRASPPESTSTACSTSAADSPHSSAIRCRAGSRSPAGSTRSADPTHRPHPPTPPTDASAFEQFRATEGAELLEPAHPTSAIEHKRTAEARNCSNPQGRAAGESSCYDVRASIDPGGIPHGRVSCPCCLRRTVELLREAGERWVGPEWGVTDPDDVGEGCAT